MPKLKIQVEMSEHLFHAYRCEAERCDKRMEDLVAKLVNDLLREMERELDDPPVPLS
jgi:hypothetical protein